MLTKKELMQKRRWPLCVRYAKSRRTGTGKLGVGARLPGSRLIVDRGRPGNREFTSTSYLSDSSQ
jgi:hypothetical protein